MSFQVQVYDFVFALGRFCHTKILLEGAGLSTRSGPWDWSGTPLAEGVYQRLTMMAEGFDNFFNREDFDDLSAYSEFSTDYWEIYRHSLNRSWPHLCLFNRRTLSWYVHDGTGSQSLDEQFESLRLKYMRRAERFMHCLSRAERILGVYISNAVDQRVDLNLNLEVVGALLDQVSARYPGKQINLAIFIHDPSKMYGEVSPECRRSHITLFKSNHHICPHYPWLNMRGYQMPLGIVETLRDRFQLSERLSEE